MGPSHIRRGWLLLPCAALAVLSFAGLYHLATEDDNGNQEISSAVTTSSTTTTAPSTATTTTTTRSQQVNQATPIAATSQAEQPTQAPTSATTTSTQATTTTAPPITTTEPPCSDPVPTAPPQTTGSQCNPRSLEVIGTCAEGFQISAGGGWTPGVNYQVFLWDPNGNPVVQGEQGMVPIWEDGSVPSDTPDGWSFDCATHGTAGPGLYSIVIVQLDTPPGMDGYNENPWGATNFYVDS